MPLNVFDIEIIEIVQKAYLSLKISVFDCGE